MRVDRFSHTYLERHAIIQQLQDAGVTIESVEPYNAHFEQLLANVRRVHPSAHIEHKENI
jgi:DNA-binding transcriptional MerR regulator